MDRFRGPRRLRLPSAAVLGAGVGVMGMAATVGAESDAAGERALAVPNGTYTPWWRALGRSQKRRIRVHARPGGYMTFHYMA